MSQPSSRSLVAESLQDIINNIERIERYVSGLDAAGLAADELRYDAVERCLERICEAAFRLGDIAETLMPDQAWRAIRGMGNRLRHAYDHIDTDVIWGVVVGRLPQLKRAVAQALATWQANNGA